MKAEITACGEDALYNEIEFPLAQVLADMTRTGILVDREGIETFGVQLRQELDQVLTRIEMEAGTSDFNPNSPKQLGTLLFDTMGLPHGKKRRTAGPPMPRHWKSCGTSRWWRTFSSTVPARS